MFAGKKSAQNREILISESAWEEMTCLFAPSLADVSLDAVSYIPVVNWFGSSASGTKKELVIMFDGDKVQRYSMSESPVSTKTGVFK
ncbi:hypothetical protein [Klebsiella pneumoniae]|uniref:hypothetical protein n=1 Tax=Klebsiella pneumoniae TaxID=573 RepID=UPI002118DA11|nr:hypothetical protein [Klebsiella pneumoniae]